jgi:hypothetical protein
LCYQAQAIISINQIGLAVWGWALTGSVIAYERITRPSSPEVLNSLNTGKSPKPRSDSSSSTFLVGVFGFALGISIAFPPFMADSAWRSAIKSGSAERVIAASERWPLDSYRQANVAVLLAENKFDAQSADVARKATAFNPNYFDAWKVLAGIPGSTPEEKNKAIAEMKRLDPRNTSIK